MSKNKYNTIKRVNRNNFYRPTNIVNTKTGEISLKQFNLFISNFIDPFDWGNAKCHFYKQNYPTCHPTAENLNLALRSTRTSKSKNSDKTYTHPSSDLFRLTLKNLERHLYSLDKKYRVYYVNSQFCSCPFICFDIDPNDDDTTTPEDLELVSDFLLSIHPNSYFELSSSGKGLHFYILLDLEVDKVDFTVWNKYFSDYADILREYINSHYNVKFDDIKSTFSNYQPIDDYFNDIDSITNYTSLCLKNCGVLCKLPKPITFENYITLYNMPFTSLSQIQKNSEQLNTDKKKSSEKVITTKSTIINTITTVWVPKPALNSKKQGLINNSMEIEREYILKYIREYYKDHSKLPTVEQCYSDYLISTGYSKTDIERQNRFNGIFKFCVKSFNPDSLVKKRTIGMYYKKDYVEDLKKLLPEDKLKQMQKDINPKFKGKITYEDISIAAGFYFVSLTRLLEQKNWSWKEFTVAQNNMKKWFSSLNSKFETSRTCTNSNKVHLLKTILIRLGWLSCIDDDYIICKQSRRHILTAKFPRYSEFVELVGQDNISKWINFSAEKKQIKTSA